MILIINMSFKMKILLYRYFANCSIYMDIGKGYLTVDKNVMVDIKDPSGGTVKEGTLVLLPGDKVALKVQEGDSKVIHELGELAKALEKNDIELETLLRFDDDDENAKPSGFLIRISPEKKDD